MHVRQWLNWRHVCLHLGAFVKFLLQWIIVNWIKITQALPSLVYLHYWLFLYLMLQNKSADVMITTADALFAECWGHSAKPAKHSVNALPCAVLGEGLSAKISLPSAKNRHSAKSLPSAKPALGKKITAVNIWRRLCRVPRDWHSAKFEFLPRARA